MWLIISNAYIIKKILSVFFTGMVIKIMDDYLDQDIDFLQKDQNLFTVIEYGGLPYALILLSLAFVFDPVTSLSLFLGSFALGMAGDLTVKMPSGLYGYQESIIVTALGLLFLKINMASSIFIMISIQLWDDYKDSDKDMINSKNWAFLLGKVECVLLTVIFFLLTFYLDYVKAISSIISMKVIEYIIKLLLTKHKKAHEFLNSEGKISNA
ncbi:MAG TPA: hypothetical protein GXZ27_12410 [Thermoanaerobacterales bacterium]|nr:hypothetical protein [Thermoanaerobacterales bacterium]